MKLEKRLSQMSFFAFTFTVTFTLRIPVTWLFKDSLEEKKNTVKIELSLRRQKKKIEFFFSSISH